MLGLLGCAEISRQQVEHHLAALVEVYDATVPVMMSSFPFSADISRLSRHILTDGSREFIEAGLHREAVFWLAVTHARCAEVLATDAPDLASRFAEPFRALLADLGVGTYASLRAKAEQTVALLPEIEQCAEAIIASRSQGG
jgi:hypothetical protein